MIENFEKNIQGRDFVIGDIHGHFDALMDALDSVHFDKNLDRLFALGDLGDRGKDSKSVYELLESDWFFSILGNHDQFIIESIELAGHKQSEVIENHEHNGGQWFQELSKSDQQAIYERVKQLPFVIDLETSMGNIGLVHAEVPKPFDDWQDFIQALPDSPDLQNECLWNRQAITDGYDYFRGKYYHPDYRIERKIKSIELVVHGHTGVYEPVIWFNQVWIDTFGKTKQFMLLEVNDLVELVRNNQ